MSDHRLLARAWRSELPVLEGRQVRLCEPTASDVDEIVRVLACADATRFGMDEPVNDFSVQQYIERAIAERAAGRAFSYAVILKANEAVVGLVHIRQLDPAFEAGEWECTLLPEVRGTGVFLETARLVATLAFRTIGTHRLEARVLLQHGRANGALRKLGAVQEGILRRSVQRSGQYFDQVLWSVLRDDWGEQRTSSADRVH